MLALLAVLTIAKVESNPPRLLDDETNITHSHDWRWQFGVGWCDVSFVVSYAFRL